MVRALRKFVMILTAAALIVSALPFSVHATPNTHPNTHVNTGDQRKDIIAVALTQVGYYEGYNNDTKYGVWYGYNNIAWCGIFVAWCADQAGVPTTVLKKTGIANPVSYGLATKPDGYIPISGDLFFARDNSHVGFVYYVDGDYFYSLEGNTWENGPEGVYIRRHRISDVKFASPNYQGGGSHNYVQGSESAHPHREYYKCSICGDQYYTGKTVAKSDCTTCIQSNCSHSYTVWSKVSDTRHSRSCRLCLKQESADHSWNNGTVTKAATCSAAGSKTQTCTGCGTSRTVTIPKTGVHNYSAWKSTGDQHHSRSCTVCAITETKAHDLTEWETDEEGHWRTCKTCSVKLQDDDHKFGKECDSPCEVCEYTRPDGHQFSTEWKTDASAHWYECDVCGLKKEEQTHKFAADCDESCDTCGYLRETDHSYSDAWLSDGNDHWHACSVCGQVKDLQAHNPEEVSRVGAIAHCTVCRLVLTSEAEHIHGYDTISFDEKGHWGSCSCGITMETQSHQWSVKTDTCSVCGQTMPKIQEDYSELIPWACGAGGLLLVGIVLIALLLRKKSAV